MNQTRSQKIGTLVGCIKDVVDRQDNGELESSISFFQKGSLIGRDKFSTVSWSELNSNARQMAGALQSEGVAQGSHVAIIADTSQEMVTAIQAIWLCGATVVVVPLPYRLSSADAFVEATIQRLIEADCSHAILDRLISRVAGKQKLDASNAKVLSLSKLAKVKDQAFSEVDISADDLMIMQFTSGSTSNPKGVMLQNNQLVANLDAITAGGEIDPVTDTFVSWLPLHHDMGLIGMLTYTMTHGVNLVISSPGDFLESPKRWMQWISDFGGTITAGPNFSYALAGRGLKSQDGLDLSKIRIALNGAEPVNPNTAREFAKAGEKFGLNPNCVFPAFGMAEVCIAGSFGDLSEGLRTDFIDPTVLEQEHYAKPTVVKQQGRELAILGRPVQGLEFRIVEPSSAEVLEERFVGELQIKGSSVTPGYFKDPTATAAVFDGDWFKTGDLAYLVDGELVLCGRIKDVIIIGGRNLYPQDIEAGVSDLPGVRDGNVIAVGLQTDEKESIVVIAETKEKSGYDDIRSAIKQSVIATVGVPPSKVVLVKPSTLPKTSSGKVQRSLAKKQYLAGELKAL